MDKNIVVQSGNSAPNIADFQDQLPPMTNKEFDDHLATNDVKLLVYQLLSETDNQNDDKMRQRKNFADLRGKYQKKYEGFAFRYPSLFTLVLEQGKAFDLLQFEQMIGMIDKVRNKETDEHTASKQFGEIMVDKFVKPNLPQSQ
jgi:hypothetical protein